MEDDTFKRQLGGGAARRTRQVEEIPKNNYEIATIDFSATSQPFKKVRTIKNRDIRQSRDRDGGDGSLSFRLSAAAPGAIKGHRKAESTMIDPASSFVDPGLSQREDKMGRDNSQEGGKKFRLSSLTKFKEQPSGRVKDILSNLQLKQGAKQGALDSARVNLKNVRKADFSMDRETSNKYQVAALPQEPATKQPMYQNRDIVTSNINLVQNITNYNMDPSGTPKQGDGVFTPRGNFAAV
jgi:hypothetical protein